MLETAASVGWKVKGAIVWFRGIDRLVREIQKAGASSLNAIADALNKRGIRTARGKEWTHVQVGHVLWRAT
jgi:hypothetical protein